MYHQYNRDPVAMAVTINNQDININMLSPRMLIFSLFITFNDVVVFMIHYYVIFMSINEKMEWKMKEKKSKMAINI